MQKNHTILLRLGIAVIILLLVPFIAMFFTDQVRWGFLDFVIMGSLLFGVALPVYVALTQMTNRWHKIIAIILALIFFALAWAELGVGIFGTLFAGN